MEREMDKRRGGDSLACLCNWLWVLAPLVLPRMSLEEL